MRAPLPLSRRTLLQLLALSLGSGCGGCGPAATPRTPRDDDPTPENPEPLDALLSSWRELRDAVRASPDHLLARAEAAVAARDLEEIVRVARDAIRTIPAGASDFGSLQLLWGPRGALRSATGSLWDKAELLRSMLVDAGFEVRVLEGRALDDASWVSTQVVAHAPPAFSPAIDDARLSELLGADDGASPSVVVDPDGSEARALADVLEAALESVTPPAAFAQQAPFFVPVVEVNVDGVWRVIDVSTRELPIGETRTTGSLTPAAALRPTPQVTLTLLSVDNTRLQHREPLVSIERSVQELIGRALWIGAVPAAPLESVLTQPLTEIRRFVPVMALRTPGAAVSEAALAGEDPDVAVGHGLDVSGAVIPVDAATGAASYGGAPLTFASEPAALAAVDALTLAVGATRFPLVEGTVRALDADGAPVAGLGSDAFSITEDGVEVAASFTEHTAPPPRVLFVLDRSLSIPAEIRDGAPALLEAIAQDVLDAFPASMFRLLVVGGRVQEGAWTASPATLAEAATTQPGGSSELWRAIDEAIDVLPTQIVLISDGVTMDVVTEPVRAKLGRCPPALFVGVGEGEHALLQEWAALTGGSYQALVGVDAVRASAVDAVAARQVPRHVFTYVAAEEGAASRTVAVSLRARAAITIDASYAVPPPVERAPRPRLQALVLRIEVENEDPVERLLYGALDEGASEDVFAQVHAALFGACEVRFEGGAPTLSTILDELFSARLGLEPVLRPYVAGDTKAAIEAALRGVPSGFAAARTLAQAVAPAEAGVCATGLRVHVHSGFRRFDTTSLVRADVTPLGAHRSLLADAALARREAVRAGARLAWLERASSDDDTTRRLAGRALGVLRPFEEITVARPGAALDEVAAWRRVMRGYEAGVRLVPLEGAADAFWFVDTRTHAPLGVLTDGSGGGMTEGGGGCGTGSVLDGAAALASLLGLLGVLSGPLAGWVGLSIAIQRKALAATIIMEALLPTESTLDPAEDGASSEVPDPGSDVATALGDALLEAAAGQLGVLGEIVTGAMNARTAADVGSGLAGLAGDCL